MNPSMRSALRRLGWGLVFPLVDLHLGSFDVLPDLIGYIMIRIALGQLGTVDISFKKASWLAAVLIFLSLPQLMVKTSIDINQLTTAPLRHACLHSRNSHSACSARLFDLSRTVCGRETDSSTGAAGYHCHQAEALHGQSLRGFLFIRFC